MSITIQRRFHKLLGPIVFWCGWPWFDEGLPGLADWLVSLLSNLAKYCKYMKSRPFLVGKFNEVGKCDLLRLICWSNLNKISKY
jgi:hypothetical protein